ncbi:MAG: DUF4058 domain-containing protein [Candidatus Eremiobacterota bacterium]
MNLLDHFAPPLSRSRHWHSFHNAWATFIASELNRVLPPGYFAEPNVQFGVEIDVATFQESGNGGPAWRPPPASLTLPVTLCTDVAEVRVYSEEGGPVLAAAVELVSPSNKDRPEARQALVSKCASYLQEGLGLALVDVVTARAGNLHNLLLERLDTPGGRLPEDLYACAYRVLERDRQACLDVWTEPLSLGAPLPTLPLWMRGNLCVPLDLQAAYGRTCEEQRIS